jgi:hypothetical protein
VVVVVLVIVVVVIGVLVAVEVAVDVCVLVTVAIQAPQVTGHSDATSAMAQKPASGAHESRSLLLLQFGSVTVVDVVVVSVVAVMLVVVVAVVTVVGRHESQRNGQVVRITSRKLANGVLHALASVPHVLPSGTPLQSGTVVVVAVVAVVVVVHSGLS